MSSEWPDLGRDPRPPEDESRVRTSPSRGIDPWFFLFGWVAGVIVLDILNATGTHWLKWPIVSFLLVFALGITVQGRRADRRKNSGDDGI